MNREEGVKLHTGFCTIMGDPADYFTFSEIRDRGLRMCPILSQVGDNIRRFLENLMAGFIPPAISLAAKAYVENQGKIAWPRHLSGKRGVHPLVASAALVRRDRPPVILELGEITVDVLKERPWRPEEGIREVVAWAYHRYLGIGYEQLAHLPLLAHLSPNDRRRSVKRIVGRVALKLHAAAAEMGVTLEAA